MIKNQKIRVYIASGAVGDQDKGAGGMGRGRGGFRGGDKGGDKMERGKFLIKIIFIFKASFFNYSF